MASGDLRVPRPHRPALQKLLELSEEQSGALLACFEDLPSFLPSSELAAKASEVVDLSPDDAEALVRVVLSLSSQRKYHGWAAKDLAGQVATSADLELDNAQQELLTGRLVRLLQADSLASTARAIDVQTEHQRVFHDARVLTDVRPVFDDEPAIRPSGAVITHTLKVDYFESGEFREIYIALDHADLVRLESVVDRALAKTKSTEQLLDGTELKLFNMETRHSSGTA
jgi:hypothetical protein